MQPGRLERQPDPVPLADGQPVSRTISMTRAHYAAGVQSPPIPRQRWRLVDAGGARVELMEIDACDPVDPGRLGDPVLFLPGWGLTARAYVPALLPLARAGLRVIAPSLPGFGASTPLGLRAPLAAYARRIIALLDVLDPEKPVFAVGHSFGGGVALKVAQLRPDLIRSVTVVNPVGGAPDRRGLRQATWLGWSLAGAAGNLHREFSRRPERINPRQAARVALDLLPSLTRHPLRSAMSGVVALTSQLGDEARQLADSGMPMLYVWGDRDRLVLPGQLHGVGGPESTNVVPGGHGWVITHPMEFAATLHEAFVVQAMLERDVRGTPPVSVPDPMDSAGTAADTESNLAHLFPPERRRRARHIPLPRPPLAPVPRRPMGGR